MEPLERGAGLVFCSAVSEDELDGNWQRLIMTHLAEKEHLGVLTGSPVTDMKITLTAGRGHLKHTEGGDFRQATLQGRQRAQKAESILLEPMYDFYHRSPGHKSRTPSGRPSRMGVCTGLPQTSQDGLASTVEGTGPVALCRTIQYNYLPIRAEEEKSP